LALLLEEWAEGWQVVQSVLRPDQKRAKRFAGNSRGQSS
jgi:hypothetical protein